jgi:hypothetical protein
MTTITRGTITGKGWTLRHDALLRAATSRYRASLGSLPEHHGRCFEFSAIAAVAALELNINATQCVGIWHAPGAPMAHAWLEVDGYILHSPHKFEVEIVPFNPAEFQRAVP